MEVNDEMGALKELLEQTTCVLKQGGRGAVITLRFIEDRVGENFFQGQGTFEAPEEELRLKAEK